MLAWPVLTGLSLHRARRTACAAMSVSSAGMHLIMAYGQLHTLKAGY